MPVRQFSMRNARQPSGLSRVRMPLISAGSRAGVFGRPRLEPDRSTTFSRGPHEPVQIRIRHGYPLNYKMPLVPLLALPRGIPSCQSANGRAFPVSKGETIPYHQARQFLLAYHCTQFVVSYPIRPCVVPAPPHFLPLHSLKKNAMGAVRQYSERYRLRRGSD